MSLKKTFLFIFILPATLFIDLILYAMIRTCPTCGSFSQFLQSEWALSFPIVIGLTEWLDRLLIDFKVSTVKDQKPKTKDK